MSQVAGAQPNNFIQAEAASRLGLTQALGSKMAHLFSDSSMDIPQRTLTRWADACLHMNHLGTLVQRELEDGNFARAQDLSHRARVRAWELLNELLAAGASKPNRYAELETRARQFNQAGVMRSTVSDALGSTMNFADLWHSSESGAWDHALQRYSQFVQPRNVELERALDALDVNRLRSLTPQGWYNFLHDEYFRWKYTAPNRYATTTIQLRRYLDDGELNKLDSLRQQLLNLDRNNIRRGITTATKIRGLGTAGASGLLSLMFPQQFATVDQFVVKALKLVPDLQEATALEGMNPENLSISDGVLLIGVLTRKANENNQLFGTSAWTPRKIDKVLWTYGR